MTDTPIREANGARIPALGFGTWPLKGEDCARAVAAALEAGFRHVDTAAMYGNEEAVGEGLRASGLGEREVFLTTKIWWDQLSRSDAVRSAEASATKLERIPDLLLIHWPDTAMSVADMMAALDGCRREGLARHVGVSNFPAGMLEEAVARADGPLACNQCEYHPELDQSRVIEACRRHGLAFVSYSPLGKGKAFGNPTLREIAEAHGATPGQVVIAWHLAQPDVVAIPKTAKPERMRENLGALDLRLSDEDMRRLHGLARPDGRQIDPDWAPDWAA